ncbi:cyclase family protein [Streptacidiphilus sp. ASG 303]|uniref:cyclase family protein n=1 Tax=Streptacidiphilus sp. ASG 303 TaxID=2896847 RepID=UPI001E6189C3|nr:cyclase family protein [Streptacidiphilus sp. ASG 303]MCD0486343.1 cyclase family protein [Streptacidiphilus sp. ASG 303]
MHLIDLSQPVDADGWEPDPVVHEIMTPAEGARHMCEEMRLHFGIEFDPADLPGGELLSLDTLTLTSHTGTHVDAPSHYGSAGEYGRPRTIDEMPLDWFLRPAVVLDLTDAGTGVIGVDRIEKELARTGYRVQPLDIVLLHTGASRHAGTPRYFTDFAGLDGPAVDHLLDLGVRVIGTDAWSLDAPFGHMIRAYQETGDPAVLWPAHFAGRRREYCQIERLTGLERLPAPYGFRVSALPVKIAGAGAGWTRAVALVDE